MPIAALSGTAIALIAAMAVVQVALLAFVLVDLVRRPAAAVTFGSRLPWFVIVIVAEFVGPILYLAVGRRDVPMRDGAVPERADDAGGRDRAQRTVDLLYGPEKDA